MCYNIFKMGDIMNKKGFTLIELLVTIVIIGLISFIGFPSLMALINNNKTTEFEYYGKLMVDAAKLYIRKEATDLQEAGEFNKPNGYTVTLKTLIDEEYINEYKPTKQNLSCDMSKEKAFINITYDSSSGTYTFKYNLVCQDTSTNKKYTKNYDNSKFVISNLS